MVWQRGFNTPEGRSWADTIMIIKAFTVYFNFMLNFFTAVHDIMVAGEFVMASFAGELLPFTKQQSLSLKGSMNAECKKREKLVNVCFNESWIRRMVIHAAWKISIKKKLQQHSVFIYPQLANRLTALTSQCSLVFFPSHPLLQPQYILQTPFFCFHDISCLKKNTKAGYIKPLVSLVSNFFITRSLLFIGWNEAELR